jgi:hypothetical protein
MRSVHRGFCPLALTKLCILILRREDKALGLLDCKFHVAFNERVQLHVKGHNVARVPHLHAITPSDEIPDGIVAPHM